MFGRKKTEDDVVVEYPPLPVETPVAGKGRPTPKRRDAEAANRRPLITGDKKVDKEKSRAEAAKQRTLMDQALKTGDEKYLPAQHKGKARRFARDYIDARWTLGEFFLPIALLVVIVMFGGTAIGLPPAVVVYAILALYVVVLVAIVEAVIYSSIVRKRVLAVLGRQQVRGLRLYTAMRSMQMRRMRLPKPQVKRGDKPVLTAQA